MRASIIIKVAAGFLVVIGTSGTCVTTWVLIKYKDWSIVNAILVPTAIFAVIIITIYTLYILSPHIASWYSLRKLRAHLNATTAHREAKQREEERIAKSKQLKSVNAFNRGIMDWVTGVEQRRPELGSQTGRSIDWPEPEGVELKENVRVNDRSDRGVVIWEDMEWEDVPPDVKVDDPQIIGRAITTPRSDGGYDVEACPEEAF